MHEYPRVHEARMSPLGIVTDLLAVAPSNQGLQPFHSVIQVKNLVAKQHLTNALTHYYMSHTHTTPPPPPPPHTHTHTQMILVHVFEVT